MIKNKIDKYFNIIKKNLNKIHKIRKCKDRNLRDEAN